MTTTTHPPIVADGIEQDCPSGWFELPARYDVGDVSSSTLLTREGGTVTLKLPSEELALTAWQTIELAALFRKPRRAARLAALLDLLCSTSSESAADASA